MSEVREAGGGTSPEKDIMKLKIALFGHWLGSGNLGVDALTRSHLMMIDTAAESLGVDVGVDIFAGSVSLSSVKYGKRLNVRQLPNPIFPKRIVRNVLTLPARLSRYPVIFDLSEGDSFADIYGWRRAYVHSMQKLLSGWSGSKVVISPMTIGPFRTFIWRILASMALRGSAHVFARDEVSADVARLLKCRRVQISTDLALAMSVDTREQEGFPGEGLRVGVNVSGLLWSGGYTGKNQFGIRGDYPQIIKSIISFLEKKEGVHIHLVPHVYAPGTAEDDIFPCRDLLEQFPNCHLAPCFEDSVAAKKYISALDFFIGSRMHACIAALSSGVPCLPLAYSMKFEGLFGSLGYNRTVDLRSESVETVLLAVRRAFEERAEIEVEVEAAILRAEVLLQTYRKTVHQVLKEAISE